MLSQEIQNNLEKIRKSVLVLDIETSAFLPDGTEISIKTNFDDYIANAKVKWVGIYSYKYNQGYYLNAQTEAGTVLKLLNEHDVLVGFNIEDFDYPILVNNGFTNPEKRYIQVDCMQILGTVNQRNKQGYTFKNRAALMDYKLKNNHLRGMAEVMQLEHQKGDIDWHIFQKDEWTEAEILEIKKYLYSDVMATKGLYEKLWYYWLPFAELLPEKNVYDLSWIRSSIASLTYKAACHVLNVEPTYSEKPGTEEAMGGNVYEPKYEELNGVWYVDFGSLYPHLMVMANISAEVDMERVPSDAKLWHGNEIFQVKGYYDISKFHPLSDYIAAKLKQRIALKELDKTDPMVYTLKILLNCFSSDTAVVMADNSVKNIKDCKIGEYLWSINPNTLYAEKKKIIKTFEYDYNGDIHYYQGKYFNFKVTPNHRFLLHKVNNDTGIISEPKFYESQEITTNYKLPIHKNKKQNNKKNINILDYFPNDYFLYSIKSKSRHGRTWLTLYNLNGKYLDYNCNNTNFIFDLISIKDVYNKLLQDNDLDIYLFKNGRRREHKKPILYNNDAFSYLIGIYLSEGSATYTKSKKYENGNCRGENYSIQLAQYKNINPIIYKKIQDSLDKCGLKYSAGKTGFKVTGSIFYDFILNNFGKLNYKHFINKKLFDELNLRKVWEGLIDGDGSKKSNLYTTKYDCLKNDFIELCIRLGYTFVIKNDGCWRIVYNKSQNVFRPTLRTIEKYNDKVYCVEVEENNTLLAGRNNYFNWSGNSFYGVMRSPIFEKVHTPNAGWDICWLGQQVQQLLKEMIEQFGFEVVMGDTDSVTKDTPILIKYENQVQILPIEDLFQSPNTSTKSKIDISNKNILVWTDKGWSKIKYIYRHKTRKEMFRILTRKGFVEVSADHSLVINNKSITPKNLKIGDSIELISTKLPQLYDIDKDLCWLLGFWLAEGTTGFYKYASGNKYSWALNQKENVRLERAKQILLKYGLNTTILNTIKSSNCNKLVPANHNTVVFYELFKEWCLTKTGDKKVPSFILNSNLESKKAFIAGYLEGDGSIENKNQISFCSIDKSLFSGICQMWADLGYEYSLRTRNDKPNVITARILRNVNHSKVGKYNIIKKIETYINTDNIYDIETENHHFCGGIGNINLHNSCFFVAKEGTLNTREYVQDCLNQITDIIKDSFPFPVDTFKINIEHYLEHLMIPFEEQSVVGEDGKNKKENGKLIKERKGKKKNYLYIYKDNGELKIKLVGLPIIKDNATQLGPKIYEEVLKPEILKNNRAKFPESFIEQTITDYLKKPEIMQLLSQEHKVNALSSYKLPGQIQAQISKGYFNGGEGVIRLIKNTRVGKAGKGMLYCSIQEATDAKLTAEELDLDKVRQELSPFIEFKEEVSPALKEACKILSKDDKSLQELANDYCQLQETKKKRGRPRKEKKQ